LTSKFATPAVRETGRRGKGRGKKAGSVNDMTGDGKRGRIYISPPRRPSRLSGENRSGVKGELALEKTSSRSGGYEINGFTLTGLQKTVCGGADPSSRPTTLTSQKKPYKKIQSRASQRGIIRKAKDSETSSGSGLGSHARGTP